MVKQVKGKSEEESSDKAFVMQSVSLLEDLGLGIDSTNY